MNTLLPALSAIFLPIILGMLSKKGKFINPANRQIIQQFAVRIAVPLMAFNSLRTVNVKAAGQFLPMSLGLFLFFGIVWVISWVILNTFFGKAPWFTQHKAEIILMSFGGNIGYICWKLHELLIGPEGLQRGIFYTSFYLPGLLLYAFLTVWVLKLSKHKNLDMKNILFSIIPLLIMIASGLYAGVTGTATPQWINQFAESFGSMAVPLILFCMGLSISIRNTITITRTIIPFLIVRLFIWIGVTAIMLQLPWFDEISRKVLFINAMAPLGMNPLIITDIFDLDSDFVANSITISTVLFLFFLPVLFFYWR